MIYMDKSSEITKRALQWVEHVGLIGIAIATIIAAGLEVQTMIELRSVSLADLLLMFIYLEVLTMVGLYFESGQLPVRFPLYIGIVALARYLIIDIKSMSEWRILAVSLGVLVLAIAVLVIRYGHIKMPYANSPSRRRRRALEKEGEDNQPA